MITRRGFLKFLLAIPAIPYISAPLLADTASSKTELTLTNALLETGDIFTIGVYLNGGGLQKFKVVGSTGTTVTIDPIINAEVTHTKKEIQKAGLPYYRRFEKKRHYV